mgnify:CR=1 FL=1
MPLTMARATFGQSLRHLLPHRLEPPINPALLQRERERAEADFEGFWASLAREGRPLLHITDFEVPVRSDPFIVKGEALWAELGRRYANDPRLGYVDVGGYGKYGEWWVDGAAVHITDANGLRMIKAVAAGPDFLALDFDEDGRTHRAQPRARDRARGSRAF